VNRSEGVVAGLNPRRWVAKGAGGDEVNLGYDDLGYEVVFDFSKMTQFNTP
jgi:hypothetical protein